jgi:Ca-activated chloride channel family protein
MAARALNILHHLFAHPLGLALLGMLLVFGLAGLLARRRRRRALAWLGSTVALRTLLAEQPLLQRLRRSCLTTGLMLLALGVAGPQWGRDWDQPAAPGRDVVVVLDLSRSMLAEAPSRLQRAKDALVDLSYAVQRRGGHRLALVVFAGRARLVCPLTHDYDHFREALDRLDAGDPPPDVAPGPDAESGTRIGEGLRLAVETHDPRFHGAQDILLISDGDDPARDGEWRAGTEEAREAQIPVHTVGVGNPDVDSPIPLRDGQQQYQGKPVTTRLQEQPLQEIARLSKGTYTAAQTHPLPLGELFHDRIEARTVREDTEDSLPVYHQRFALFLGPALFFLGAEMALGWIGKRSNGRRPSYAASGRGSARQEKTMETKERETPRISLVTALSSLVFAVLISARSPRAQPAGNCLLLALLGVILLGAAPVLDPEELVRQGNAASDREDYAAAVDLYTQAEDRTADPGQVAFNEATALYHLAGQPENAGRRASLYREAELHYRRCLDDPDGGRRVKALYGLGNALLQQGAGRGADTLRQAVQVYQQCLAEEAITPELACDARHNLQLAKLLWLQAKAAKKDQRSDEEKDDNDPAHQPPRKQPDNSQPGAGDPLTGAPDRSGERVRAKPLPGEQPIKTDEPQPPGEGNLPPPADKDELVPMPPEDAAAHLQRAAEQVLRERRAHQQQSARPPAGSVKDW